MQFSLVGSKYLGRVIRQYRDKKDWTQTELANTVECHTQFVSNWERGLSTPPMYMLKIIQSELGIPKAKIITVLKKEMSSRIDKIFN